MNRLPYRNESFDVVLASATTHHSPDLPGLMKELARVVRPGGWLLVLNDPVHGLLKHAFNRLANWSRKGGVRNELIHENEYSPLAYRRLARQNNMELHESFFSVYYDRKLREGNVAGVRFAPLARVAVLAWKIPPLRWFLSKAMLLPAQLLIGLELNAIFLKRSG
jgi:SAM-dependent methyltransferase